MKRLSVDEFSPLEKVVYASALRQNFRLFVKSFFWFHERTDFILSRHHETIIDALIDVYEGKTTKLLINVPPRYSKTELVIKLFPAWAYTRNNTCKFIHLSYSASLAMDNSSKVKEIMKVDEYRTLFPEVVIKRDRDAKGEWETEGGGKFYATSSGGAVTGFGAGAIEEVFTADDQKSGLGVEGEFKFCGAILIDDPLKPDDAHSDVIRRFINGRWGGTIKSRRNNPTTTPVIVIMQRLHEDDFTAHLLNEEPGEWTHICMPALVDDDEGEARALWPHMHDVAALRKMKDTDIYTFSGQYQQEPTPKGGSIFKTEWWQYCFEFPEFERVEIFADTAMKTKEANDYSVFQAWGVAKGKIYLIDQIRGKWESPELKRVATSFIKRIKAAHRKLYRVNIEDKASGTGLIQSLKREAHCTINAVQRNVDKVTRAYDAAPHVQSGNVVLLVGAPHNGVFVSECTSLTATMSHQHDDQVDPMMDATKVMLDTGSSGVLVY